MVLWVDASNHESACESYLDLAFQAKLKGTHKWEAGKKWLGSQENDWLLILDNADDSAMDFWGNYIPAGTHGAVLVTTINTEVGDDLVGNDQNKRQSLEDLSIEESVDLLHRTACADVEDKEFREKGEAIVQELQRFPLAIVLAGAALRHNRYRLDDYLSILKSHPTRLLSSSRPVPVGTSYKHTVYAAWEILLNMICARNPRDAAVGMELLDAIAYLHNENVPELVLRQVDLQFSRSSSRRFGTALVRGMRVTQQILLRTQRDQSEVPQPFLNEEAVTSGLILLSSYFMIHHNVEKKTVSTHSLVHSWVRHRMETTRQEQMASVACEALNRSIPDGSELHDHIMRAKLYPHIRWLMEKSQGSGKLRTTTLQRFARVAQESGNFELSQRLYEEALSRLSELSRPEGPEMLSIADSLACVLENRGMYIESAQLAEKVIKGRTAHFGADSPLTLASKAKLAVALRGKGQYNQARVVNEEILHDLQRRTDDSKTEDLKMEVSNNLASILQREGDYANASQLAEKVLSFRRTRLTIDHPETLESMDNLASIKEKQDKWSEAQTLTEDVLRMRKELLGKTHPDTLTSQARLAGMLSRQGQYGKAEEILLQILESRKCVLGVEHPDTLTSLTRLAEVQIERGKHELAEDNLRSALDGYKRQFLPDHPFLRIVESSLAVCLRHQGKQQGGKYEEAENIYRNVLCGYEHRNESHHPEALLAKANLAVVLREQLKLEESEQMGREAVEGWETSRGPDNPGTLRSKDNLGWTICKTPGRLGEAEALIAGAIDGLKKVLGPEDRDTLEAIAHLAHVLYCQERYVEAWVQFSKACQGFEKAGVQHWCLRQFADLKESMRKRDI